jgi:hypothetical protein
VLEGTARSAAHLLDIHPNTAALFYKKIRHIISFHLALQASEGVDGCIERDESYFGGVRSGKRGRGAAGKAAVYGNIKRGGNVYTVVVKDTKKLNAYACDCSQKLRPTALSIQIQIRVTLRWMSVVFTISGLIM